MRTYFKNHTGHLELMDKYDASLHHFEFPLDSIIHWYPTNNNYQYYYSNKHKIIYLSEDTLQSEYKDYGVGTKDNFGVCSINNWNCPEVFIDNLKVVDYFKVNYQLNLLGFTNYSGLDYRLQKILRLILNHSINIVNAYNQQYDPDDETIEHYYELAIKISNTNERFNYFMLGKAYNLLQIYRKAMLDIAN